MPRAEQKPCVFKEVQGWVQHELCSTTFFLDWQQTLERSMWSLVIDSGFTGTTERLCAGSGGALVQPLICASFFSCCTSPLGNRLSFLNRNHSWLQNKNVWSWAVLDTAPCEVKGKLITGFKDNSLKSLLQLSFKSLPHGSYQLNISNK